MKTQVHMSSRWSVKNQCPFEHYFQTWCLHVMHAVRNHTKVVSSSFPMILFLGSTVWCSLVIFRMSWLGPGAVLNYFLTLKSQLLSLPTRHVFFREMKFVFRIWTALDKFVQICPTEEKFGSHGSPFLVLKTFNLFSRNSYLVPNVIQSIVENMSS